MAICLLALSILKPSQISKAARKNTTSVIFAISKTKFSRLIRRILLLPTSRILSPNATTILFHLSRRVSFVLFIKTWTWILKITLRFYTIITSWLKSVDLLLWQMVTAKKDQVFSFFIETLILLIQTQSPYAPVVQRYQLTRMEMY